MTLKEAFEEGYCFAGNSFHTIKTAWSASKAKKEMDDEQNDTKCTLLEYITENYDLED